MEFVMIVEPDEVGRKRLEAVFQTEKPSFSYQITGRPEEALDILEHQKTDVLVCETSLSVLSGREFFTMAKMISPDTVRVAMTSAEHVKDILSFLNECDIYKLIMKPCASFADFIEPVNAALEYHRLKKQAESDLEQANMNLFFSEKDFERIEERQKAGSRGCHDDAEAAFDDRADGFRGRIHDGTLSEGSARILSGDNDP